MRSHGAAGEPAKDAGRVTPDWPDTPAIRRRATARFVLIGCDVRPAPALRERCVVVLGAGIEDWADGRCEVAVFGDDAFVRLDPKLVARQLRRSGTDAILCPVRPCWNALTPWIRTLDARVVVPADLGPAVRQALWRAASRRPTVFEWLRESSFDSGPDAFALVACFPHLPRLDVSTWARRVSIDRHALKRRCSRAGLATPSATIESYIAFAAVLLHERGAPYDEIARALGRHDGSGIHKILRRRREPR